MGWYSESYWRPYVSVAQKKKQAVKKAAQLAKKQRRQPSPVVLEGRKIANTFWGKAWCDNLQAYSDFANRLPRGATYVRNGSVVDLVIKPRAIEALVAGSETYTVTISITSLAKQDWAKIKKECSAEIESLLDLLAGRFSDGVMQRLTRQDAGLFPSPREIEMKCSCPDYSYCCKHLAAVMYGIGSRLDSQPELLFLLRGVDHQELVSAAVADGNLERELSEKQDASLAGVDLGEMFGIEMAAAGVTPRSARTPVKSSAKDSSPRAKKPAGGKRERSAKQRAGAERTAQVVASAPVLVETDQGVATKTKRKVGRRPAAKVIVTVRKPAVRKRAK